MVAEIAAAQVLHHQVQVIAVLKILAGVDDEGALQLVQQLLLVHYAVNALLCDHPALIDSYLALDISFMA